jgi:hypothetical protein
MIHICDLTVLSSVLPLIELGAGSVEHCAATSGEAKERGPLSCDAKAAPVSCKIGWFDEWAEYVAQRVNQATSKAPIVFRSLMISLGAQDMRVLLVEGTRLLS